MSVLAVYLDEMSACVPCALGDAHPEHDARPAAPRRAGVVGVIYTLHLDRPFSHAKHYTGWTSNLEARLREHEAGRGSRLLAHARAAGIGWTLAALEVGDRFRERSLKTRGGAARRCPVCAGRSGAGLTLPPDRV